MGSAEEAKLPNVSSPLARLPNFPFLIDTETAQFSLSGIINVNVCFKIKRGLHQSDSIHE